MKRGEIENRTGGIPSDYTQLAWIQSDGQQYIDTGLRSGSKTTYILDCVPKSTGVFVGCMTAYPELAKAYLASGINRIQMGYREGYNTGVSPVLDAGSINNSADNSTRYKFECNVQSGNNYLKKDDTVVFTSTETIVYARGINIFVGARNTGGSANAFTRVRIYELFVLVDDMLTGWFLPALRNSDNKPGLFDIVRQEFFTNQGSGEFTYGYI